MFDEAIKDAEKVISLSPDKAWVYAERANI